MLSRILVFSGRYSTVSEIPGRDFLGEGPKSYTSVTQVTALIWQELVHM